MAALLVDSAPAPADGAEPAAGSAPAPSPPAGHAPPATDRACSACGAPMSPGQDWCLQCGAGEPGSLSSGGWRSGAAILLGSAVLALVAAGAAVAALSKSSPHRATVVAVARVPSATAPVTPVPATPTTPAVVPPALNNTATALPKVPVTPTVPNAAAKPTTTPTTPTTTTPAGGGTETTGEGSGSQPSAILLDTNAASTYNPYSYPTTGFGDPSLTIDGDASTAWTAQVEPDKAPKMAVGVVVNLGSSQKLSELELITRTPGIRVQVYGSNGHTAPSSITDPSWVPLSHSLLASKKHTKIKLLSSTKPFRLVVLWISAAPASAVGTEQAPGHISVNEIELFPAG